MPYNRNNKNDKPVRREPSKPDSYRKKRVDPDHDAPQGNYDPNDKDELAPPRFLAAPPRFDKSNRPGDDRPKRPYEKRTNNDSGERPKRAYVKKEGGNFRDPNKKPYEKRDSAGFGDRPKRPYEKRDNGGFSDRPKRPYEKKTGDSFNDGPKRTYVKRDSGDFGEKPKRPYVRKDSAGFGDRPKRPYEKKTGDSFNDRPKRTYEKRDSGDFGEKPKRPYVRKDSAGFSEQPKRPYERKTGENFGDRPKRPYETRDAEARKPFRPNYDPEVKVKKAYNDVQKKTFSERKKELTGETVSKEDIRLNKYVANSGVCSRREADELIKKGKVTVNGKVITEMGHKVKPTDTVTYEGKKILPEPYVYILMNKPKDFLTTTEDDKGRKTVMDLVADKIEQRIFPVGRLDRNTTGVLLLTNDGEVTQALTHPSFEIKKVYQAELDKKATSADLDKLVNGIELEDGEAHADAIAFVETEDKRHVGIEIHSGRNRIVRRMFEHLGYEVVKLDRVSFGIFTKKDLPRGKWRHLTQSEVSFLMKLKNKM